MATVVRLTEMPNETNFAPLGVLGYCLTQTNFLAGVWAELQLPLKAVEHTPEAKLLDVVVSILAGCRGISQVNTRLRPDLALAQAWGRAGFADQSTLARTLDTFRPEQVAQLRQGSEALFRQESRVLHHDFEHDWLLLDVDLTSLPISKHAEGSTKGKFPKKTPTVANWRACMRRSTTRPSSRASIRASRTAGRATFPCSTPYNLVLASRQPRNSVPYSARTPGLAATPTLIML